MLKETDARAMLNGERIDYWLSVGAQPSDKVKVLIKKYGTNGTHLEQQKNAIGRLQIRPTAPPPVAIKAPEPVQEAAPADESPAAQESGEVATDATVEAPVDESASEETSEEKSENPAE